MADSGHLHICKYPECGRSFDWRSSLVAHEESHIPYEERTHVCGFEGCGKRFIDAVRLQKHLIVHSEKRDKFNCTQCDKVAFYLNKIII